MNDDATDATVPRNHDTSDSDSDSYSDMIMILAPAMSMDYLMQPSGKKAINKIPKNPLLVGVDNAEQVELFKKTASGFTKRAKMFFNQDMFKSLTNDDEENEGEDDGDEGEDEVDDEKTLKFRAAEATLEEHDIEGEDIKMAPGNNRFGDDEIWDG
ncbi:hypothetical protein BGZ65_001610 [Modicella reniformis]|uniref:Uncharacterized protein n=1 Tax=Modicella reniformis TaxID=1440133 RepID=A0A9P6MIR4_9FUNG|nr:hypothetical protein BGZ65_001610 [Modicella reniformis]